jgi:hypothetical protein
MGRPIRIGYDVLMNLTRNTAEAKPRLSSKLKDAIRRRVANGRSIKAACEEAGLSESGWHAAMRRPAVLDHLREVQERYVAEVEANRAAYKAQALEVAADLMRNAKSEQVRARMAEFLASEGKPGHGVQVNVDARSMAPIGYEYIPPGAQVVEVRSAKEGTDKGS